MKRLLLAFLFLVGPIWADTTMQIRNGVLTTDMNANNFKIINLALPLNPNDAANKAYVDSVAGTGGGGGGSGLPIMAGQAGKFLTTDGTVALWSLIPFSAITSTPTTLVGYGITDPVVLTTGSYSNPTWITSLVWSKITGTPTTLSGYGIATPLPISAIPTGTSNVTVAIGNDSRFSSSVTGLRKSAGLGSTDVAATPNADYVTPDAAGRTALGLVIGTNVQAFDADLTSIGNISSTNVIPYRSAADTWQTVTIGAGLSFNLGVLSATGGPSGGGEITSPSSATPPYASNVLTVFADTTGDVITTGNFTGVPVLASGVITASPQLGVVNGGTGLNTINTGEILYGSGSNVMSRLASNNLGTNKYLRSASSAVPSWQQVLFSDLASTPTTISGYGITDSFALSNNFSELGTPPGNKATARTNLGVAISGTSAAGDVEAWDADLASIAAIASTNVIPYRSGTNTWGTVTIGTGLSFSLGTLSVASGAPDVLSDITSSVDGQLTIFAGTTGKHIKASTIASGTMLKIGATNGVVAGASQAIDYAKFSDGTWSVAGTSPSPQAWSALATMMNEGTALNTGNSGAGIDGYALLPPAAQYSAGTIITYVDAVTTVNNGRNFRPQNNGTDKLDGQLYATMNTAGIWLKPFIAGGLTAGQGTYQWKSNGVDSWTSIYADGRVTKIQSPNDAQKQVFFNVESQPNDGTTHFTVSPSSAGNSVTVQPNPDPVVPGTAVVNVAGNGALSYDDIVPNPTSVPDGQAIVASGGAWTTGTISQAITPWVTLNATSAPIVWVPQAGQGQQNAYVALPNSRTIRIASAGLQAGQTFNLLVKQNASGNAVLTFVAGEAYQYYTPSNGLSTLAQSLGIANALDYYEIKFTGLPGNIYPFVVTNVKLNLTAAAPLITCNTNATSGYNAGTALGATGSFGQNATGADKFKSSEFVAAANETICSVSLPLFKTGAPSYGLHAEIRADVASATNTNGTVSTDNSFVDTGAAWGPNDVGQHITFTAGFTGGPYYIASRTDNTHITISTDRAGTTAAVPSGTATGVTSVVYGKPDSVVLSGSSTSSNSPVTDSLPDNTIDPTDPAQLTTFNDLNATLVNGTTYHLVIYGDQPSPPVSGSYVTCVYDTNTTSPYIGYVIRASALGATNWGVTSAKAKLRWTAKKL